MGAVGSSQIDEKLFGFRVFKLVENGPLQKCGVKILQDFIIPPKEIFVKKIPFYDYVVKNAGNKLELEVYSLPMRAFHNIEITVNASNPKEGFLGASVRYENWSTAHKNILHVIKVKDKSFAQRKLSLIANEDYLIAVKPEGKDILTLNKDTSDPLTLFSEIIQKNLGKEVEFFIYSTENGGRCVKARLGSDDGFKLGCEVAYGKFHELPRKGKLVEGEAHPKEEVRAGVEWEKNTSTSGCKIQEVSTEKEKGEKEEEEIVIVDEIAK